MGLRNLILSLVSRRIAADMEAESRQWILQCKQCGEETSVWDAGGLRWKGKGKAFKLMYCRPCGRSTWHTTSYRSGPS